MTHQTWLRKTNYKNLNKTSITFHQSVLTCFHVVMCYNNTKWKYETNKTQRSSVNTLWISLTYLIWSTVSYSVVCVCLSMLYRNISDWRTYLPLHHQYYLLTFFFINKTYANNRIGQFLAQIGQILINLLFKI